MTEKVPTALEGLYTALFVKDVEDLKQKFPPKHANVFAHHMTLTFEPKNLLGIKVGKESKLKIVGRASDELGDVLIVKVEDGQTDLNTKNKHLHITLSTANDENGKRVPPVYSNELIEKAIATETVEKIDPPVEIDVVEGYSTKGQVIIVDPSRPKGI